MILIKCLMRWDHFDTILRRHADKKNSSIKTNSKFELGFSDQEMEYVVCFARQDKKVEPMVSHLKINFQDMNIKISFDQESEYYIYNSIISWRNYTFKIKEKVGIKFKNGHRDDTVSYEILQENGTKKRKFIGSFSEPESLFIWEFSF